MYSSTIGTYSFTISKNIAEGDAQYLASELEKSSDAANEVYIIRNEKYPDSYRIQYKKWNGLTWSIWYETETIYILGGINYSESDFYRKFKSQFAPYYVRNRYIRYSTDSRRNFKVEATIYPKVFAGIQSDATDDDVDVFAIIEDKFNQETKRLSRLPGILGELSGYRLKQGKYYVDFDLTKLKIPCTAEQMLVLLNSGNLPFDYNDYMEYNEDYCNSHPSPIDNLPSVCDDNVGAPISVTVNQNAYRNNVIRFEIQCKYKSWKYSIQQYLKDNSADYCYDIICDYFNRTIMWGNYYTLNDAKKIIIGQKFSEKKTERLINTLESTQEHRSIYKALNYQSGERKVEFYKSLRELAGAGINPITIPEDYNIAFVQNLLDAHINGPRG